MRELPILFSTPMVQAILDGRKSMTRRICKDIPDHDFHWGLDRKPYKGNYKLFTKIEPKKWGWVTLENQCLYDLQTAVDESKTYLLKPPYQPRDHLWARETWFKNYSHQYGNYFYRADGEEIQIPTITGETMTYGKADGLKWRSPRFMPKTAARIWLEVTDVRVERLQEITEEDAITEGIEKGRTYYYGEPHKIKGSPKCYNTAKEAFKGLWDSLNAKRGYGWDTNPWVWVIEFRRTNP